MPDAQGFSSISVNLGWNSRCGGLHGRPRPLKLALGCFYELKNGATGAIQIGDSHGHFDNEPFVHLGPFEFSGVEGSQKLRINGEKWSSFRRLVVYAYNPWGAPSWHAAALSLTLSCARHQPVTIAVDHGADGNGIVALLELETRDDGIDFRRLVHFGLDQRDVAAEFGWNLSWCVQPLDFRERHTPATH